VKDRSEATRLASVATVLVGAGAQVTVAHVVETGSASEIVEMGRAVAAAAKLLRGHGITVHSHVEAIGDGGVAGTLAGLARALAVDIIVMGSRGLGGVRALAAGSISHALLAGLDQPILVLPDGAHVPPGLRRVLVAVGNEHDTPAGVAALRLLRGPVEVLAVHVPRRLAIHPPDAGAEPFLEIGETSRTVLLTARRSFKHAGVRVAVRTLDRNGGVAPAICHAARDWDADLIVLGPHRPGPWEALVAGSTAHGILHHSDRPVLIAGRSARR
jgi:nucleotide-binding universal stress UspA family protein